MLYYNSIDPKAFEWASYYGGAKTEKPVAIRVGREEGKTKAWATLGQNLSVSDNRLVLSTRYIYDYKVSKHLEYRGKFYEITSVIENEIDVAPQALSYAPPEANRAVLLYLLEVEW